MPLTRRNSTVYEQVVRADPGDDLLVEVGDSKQSDFHPQYKVMRWDNEVNLSVRAQEETGATFSDDGNGIVTYHATDYDVLIFDSPTPATEEGGFEFEWILKRPPPTNLLTATLQHKGLDFRFQPPLTAEELAPLTEQNPLGGCVRPDNVVGSYAVYHATKKNHRNGGNNYRVGKFCHIYRPEAIDNAGMRVWCDLNIDLGLGLMTVTVPQAFLDAATYPVTVDPEFGHNQIGASHSGTATDATLGSPYTITEEGTGDVIHTYMKAGSTGNARNAIYELDSEGADSHALIDEAAAYANSTNQWHDEVLVSGATLKASTEYLLVQYYTDTAFAYDSAGGAWYNFVVTYNDTDPMPDPLNDSAGSDRDYSIYVTYTATGGGGGIAVLRRRIEGY